MDTLNKSKGVTLNSGLKLVLVGTIFNKFRDDGHSLSQVTNFHVETVMNKVNCVALTKACTNTVTTIRSCSLVRTHPNNQCMHALKGVRLAREENHGGNMRRTAFTSQCRA